MVDCAQFFNADSRIVDCAQFFNADSRMVDCAQSFRNIICIKTEKLFRTHISIYLTISMIGMAIRHGWEDKCELLVKVQWHRQTPVA